MKPKKYRVMTMDEMDPFEMAMVAFREAHGNTPEVEEAIRVTRLKKLSQEQKQIKLGLT